MQIRPQPGPQTEFLQTNADICIYGGAMGGGKTYGLLMEASRHIDKPDYRGVIFRRNLKQIDNPGGLWDESTKFFANMAKANLSKYRWTFPSGATLEFAHLNEVKDIHSWHGAQLAFIGFDELTHFEEQQFFYLQSRLRSTSGIKPYLRATCNPDPSSFVKRLIKWYIGDDGLPIRERGGKLRYYVRHDGRILWGDSKKELINTYPHVFESVKVEPEVLIKSFTFIPSNVHDNPALLNEDPAYIANLHSQAEVEKQQMLYGNWNVSRKEGDYFKRDYFTILSDDKIPEDFDRLVRVWDLAETEPNQDNPDPDYTVGTLLGYKKQKGLLYVLDVARVRLGPAGVERIVRNTTEEDAAIYGVVETHIEQPPSTGKTIIARYENLLRGYPVYGHYTTGGRRTRKNRELTGKQRRAIPVSADAEKKKIFLREAAWNEPFLRELTQFGTDADVHDDIVDTLSLGHKVLSGNRKISGLGFKLPSI